MWEPDFKNTFFEEHLRMDASKNTFPKPSTLFSCFFVLSYSTNAFKSLIMKNNNFVVLRGKPFTLGLACIFFLSANLTEWSNALKTICRQRPTTNCVSVFDHFMGLALQGLRRRWDALKKLWLTFQRQLNDIKSSFYVDK